MKTRVIIYLLFMCMQLLAAQAKTAAEIRSHIDRHFPRLSAEYADVEKELLGLEKEFAEKTASDTPLSTYKNIGLRVEALKLRLGVLDAQLNELYSLKEVLDWREKNAPPVNTPPPVAITNPTPSTASSGVMTVDIRRRVTSGRTVPWGVQFSDGAVGSGATVAASVQPQDASRVSAWVQPPRGGAKGTFKAVLSTDPAVREAVVILKVHGSSGRQGILSAVEKIVVTRPVRKPIETGPQIGDDTTSELAGIIDQATKDPPPKANDPVPPSPGTQEPVREGMFAQLKGSLIPNRAESGVFTMTMDGHIIRFVMKGGHGTYTLDTRTGKLTSSALNGTQQLPIAQMVGKMAPTPIPIDLQLEHGGKVKVFIGSDGRGTARHSKNNVYFGSSPIRAGVQNGVANFKLSSGTISGDTMSGRFTAELNLNSQQKQHISFMRFSGNYSTKITNRANDL